MIEVLRLSLPITLWLTGFSAIYALQGYSCSRHWPVDLDARLVLIAGWAAAVLLQALCLTAIIAVPSHSRFVQRAATVIATGAVVAAVWTTIPVLAARGCL